MSVIRTYFVSFFFNYLLISVKGTDSINDVLLRNRRQLLFPNSTLLQFNAGVGTPSPVKNINVNWAFQANFQLPWNRTQIPYDLLVANSGYDGESRRKRHVDGYKNNAKLVHFYMYIEEVLNSFGHDGKSCVKQTLCQIGAEPLHSDDGEDLLHELATFVLNPTNDINDEHEVDHEVQHYIKAFKEGQNSENCKSIYNKCNFPLIDIFSQINNVK